MKSPLVICTLAVLSAVACSVGAQVERPVRPIRLVIPQSPGSGDFIRANGVEPD